MVFQRWSSKKLADELRVFQKTSPRSKRGKGQYACQYCMYTTQHKGHFKDHIDTHVRRRYHCEVCNKQFARERTMRTHFNLSHGADYRVFSPAFAPESSHSEPLE